MDIKKENIMLFYYTKVQVNELMTPSLLIEQVIYWI